MDFKFIGLLVGGIFISYVIGKIIDTLDAHTKQLDGISRKLDRLISPPHYEEDFYSDEDSDED